MVISLALSKGTDNKMEKYFFLIQPFIAAFTGWFTTWIAIWMLFHPRKPIRIMGLTIQGIFPKRQKMVAAQLGKMVASELIHFDEIAERLMDKEQLKGLNPVIQKHLDHFLEVKMKEKMPMLSMFVGSGTMQKIKDGMLEEIEALLPELIHKYTDTIRHKVDIEKMVSEKVSNFSSDKLENILHGVMKKEFKFIELIGGFFGFLIGLIQMAISML
jgi:uncharacterized membrane protein YheB (UPF0754 family)